MFFQVKTLFFSSGLNFGTRLNFYQSDCSDYIIPYTHTNEHDSLWNGYFIYANYVTPQTFLCPGFFPNNPTYAQDKVGDPSKNMTYSGYGYVYTMAGSGRFAKGGNLGSAAVDTTVLHISDIRYPTKMFFVMDCAMAETVGRGYVGIYRISYSKYAGTSVVGNPDPRHDGGGALNILYGDGHVRNTKVNKGDAYLTLGTGRNLVQWSGWHNTEWNLF